MIFILVILLKVCTITSVKLDYECGIDNDVAIVEGDVPFSKYPWLGILSYKNGGNRAKEIRTTVILIHREVVIGSLADTGFKSKRNFRKNARVLFAEAWGYPGQRVDDYILHPEYHETYNTICLILLRDIVTSVDIQPLCAPPKLLNNPDIYVIKMKQDMSNLNKEIFKVTHIPGNMCREFYASNNQYNRKMRPPYVVCAMVPYMKESCVWSTGSALVSRDMWGRWKLLGLGIHGLGCGAPSQFLDMASYYPWIENNLLNLQQIYINRINRQTYTVRAIPDSDTFVIMTDKYGLCHPEEKRKLLYKQQINLHDDHRGLQFYTYNMTILQDTWFHCTMIKLMNASTDSEIEIKHRCDRNSGFACYRFTSSRFDISIRLQYSGQAFLEIITWGCQTNHTMHDTHNWRWSDGTIYKDLNIQQTEHLDFKLLTDVAIESTTDNLPEFSDIELWSNPKVDNNADDPLLTPPPDYYDSLDEVKIFVPETTTTAPSPVHKAL